MSYCEFENPLKGKHEKFRGINFTKYLFWDEESPGQSFLTFGELEDPNISFSISVQISSPHPCLGWFLDVPPPEVKGDEFIRCWILDQHPPTPSKYIFDPIKYGIMVYDIKWLSYTHGVNVW